jgi:hypothetical protein
VKHLVPHDKRALDVSAREEDSVAEWEEQSNVALLIEALGVGDDVPADLIEIGGALSATLGQAPPERVLRWHRHRDGAGGQWWLDEVGAAPRNAGD